MVDTVEKQTQELEVDESEKKDESVTSKEEWDKQRQRADQLEANLKKVLNDNTALSGTVRNYEDRIGQLEKVIQLNKQQMTDIKELDPLSADIPDLVNQNKILISELKNTKDKLSTLEKLASDFQKERQSQQESEKKSAIIEKILKPLDEQYGAKFRNEAKKMADDLVDSGKVKQPEDAIDAFLLLAKCYQDVKNKVTSKEVKEKSVATDSGTGNIGYIPDEKQEGTFEQVLSDMQKRFKKK